LAAGAAPQPGLLGRGVECQVIDRVVSDVVGGAGRVLVLRGDPGIGKTALLGYLSERVAGWRVARVVGVDSDMRLPFSGLHQCCAPLLADLGSLPGPQRTALETVFGLGSGAAPDLFLVGLATLTLIAQAAERTPLACVVDDGQWLDDASAQVLGFVARRLLAERVALVCATRTGIGDRILAGMPELAVGGLRDRDARTLLLSHVHGPLDPAVTDQIVAESRGNPLALLELPRMWRAMELAGGFEPAGNQPVASTIEMSYLRQLESLPADTRLLLLAAAAEPLGDPMLLHRAAEVLGIGMATVNPAVDAGLLQVRGRVEFAHPLVRSATYRAAAAGDRQRVHRALADAATDPDRRAWHSARATPGPDEDVAAELERSADRARSRGGLAAGAAFLQRAVALTVDPTRRAERALAAAQASFHAGAFEAALRLLVTAETGPLDEFQRAQADLVRGRVAFASGLGGDAPQLLLKAAKSLETSDLRLARETYLAAWGAAWVASGQVGGGDVLLDVCRSVQTLPPSTDSSEPLDLLLDGLARLTTDGHAAAAATLKRAGERLTTIPADDVLRWGWMATPAYSAAWDFEGFCAIAARQAKIVRDAGALAQLPLYLAHLGTAYAWMGDFAGAEALIAETDSVAAVTGSGFPPYGLVRLQALQGRAAAASTVLHEALEQAAAGGRTTAVAWAHLAGAVLYNGLGRYGDALAAAERAAALTFDPWHSVWALPELIEAATRTGDIERARWAVERLARATQPCGTGFALGVEARCRALVADGAAADDGYREAVDRLTATRLRPELARSHLLYGEWLRRQGRRVDARRQLQTAHDMLTGIGMEAFAERARRELMATGEKVRKRNVDTRDQLTPQEEQIARLARDGLSNLEIGAELFISARTVEWHLRKVFTKLGVSSRRQLRRALADRGQPVATG
jgi:DNA-binding CsgD family transcriptional regulator